MKRRKGSLLDSLLDGLILLPSWISFVSGTIAFFIIEAFGNAAHFNFLLVNELAALSLMFGTLTAVIGAVYRARDARILDQLSGPEALKKMPWKDFEHLIAEYYRRRGFAVSYGLEAGPDGGVDVTLKKEGRVSIVQCKCWKKWSVGVSIVREMFGLLHHQSADEAIIVTTGDFTAEARDFANGKSITLINGPTLGKMISSVKAIPFPESPESPAQPSPTPYAETCPECGRAKVLKLARRGKNAGNKFWGCPAWPHRGGSRSMP